MATLTAKSSKQIERKFVIRPTLRGPFFRVEYEDAPGAVVPEPLRGNWTSVAYAERAVSDWRDSLSKQLNEAAVDG